MKKKIERTAIVFQGGGAFGALELGAFKKMVELGINPSVVTGVSIGAINAAVVAGCKNNNPVEALEQLWERLTVNSIPGIPNLINHVITLPYNPGMYAPNPELLYMPATATSYSVTELLKETLNQLIDWDKLNHQKNAIKLAVTALNIKTGKLAVFRNYVEPHAKADDIGPPITADHVVASGSLPPAFPMTQINGGTYWDGGLFSNTPLKPAIKALQSIEDDENTTEVKRRIIILSLFPSAGEIPSNLAEVESRKMEIAFQCKIDFDKAHMEKIKKFHEFADLVARKLPDDPQIKNHEGFKKLMSYKIIHELKEVKLEVNEGFNILPGADFTRATIRRRQTLGAAIAEKALAG